jgi:O-antigen ligase
MVLFLGIGLWPAYRLRSKFLIFVLFILTVPALLFTLSRGSILSFPLAFIITGLLARRFKSVFIFLIVIYLFTLTIPILPKDVAFGIHSSVRIFPGQEDPSWTARVDAWKYYLPRVNNYPIFGYGLASLPLGSVDNQYVMELLDTGIVGLGCLLWMLWRIFKSIFRIYNNTKDYFARSLSFGFLTGFVALLIHAFTITNFYTIRTMESFWFLLAITIVCSEGELEQT